MVNLNTCPATLVAMKHRQGRTLMNRKVSILMRSRNLTMRGMFNPCLLSLVFSGCSIAMALSGNPEPNFEAFEIGSTRKQVEIQLGRPVATKRLENRHTKDTYRFEMGNSPNGHRAMMNLYIDLATVGIWELPGTIVEAQMGEDQEASIVYDANERVVAIEGYRPPEPSQALKESIEAHEQYIAPPISQDEQ